jgi:hypothetical protein
VGVGHNEESLPLVRSPNIGSSERKPQRIVPAFGKTREHPVESSSTERCDVFNDHELGSKLANDAEILEPKAAVSTLKASSSASKRDVGAGESTADNVNGLEVVGSDCSNVIVSNSGRPVFLQDIATPLVSFCLPDCFTEPRPFKSKVKAADTTEERSDAHAVTHH